MLKGRRQIEVPNSATSLQLSQLDSGSAVVDGQLRRSGWFETLEQVEIDRPAAGRLPMFEINDRSRATVAQLQNPPSLPKSKTTLEAKCRVGISQAQITAYVMFEDVMEEGSSLVDKKRVLDFITWENMVTYWEETGEHKQLDLQDMED
jgi:hypothetical protein